MSSTEVPMNETEKPDKTCNCLVTVQFEDRGAAFSFIEDLKAYNNVTVSEDALEVPATFISYTETVIP